MAISVIPARCPQNHKCPAVQTCPTGALTQEGFGAPAVDSEKCVDCGQCVRVCPKGALVMENH